MVPTEVSAEPPDAAEKGWRWNSGTRQLWLMYHTEESKLWMAASGSREV